MELVDPTILILVLKRKKKIVINLPGTYEKLPYKREPEQTNKQTDRQTLLYFVL